MGIYLNEAGARTKYLKMLDQKEKDNANKAIEYDKIFKSPGLENTVKREARRRKWDAIEKINNSSRAAQRISGVDDTDIYDENLKLSNTYKEYKSRNKAIADPKKYGINSTIAAKYKMDSKDGKDWFNFKYGGHRNLDREYSVDDKIPGDTRKNKIQIKHNLKRKGLIKEACEYILDMLDEEYYYDEYED